MGLFTQVRFRCRETTEGGAGARDTGSGWGRGSSFRGRDDGAT